MKKEELVAKALSLGIEKKIIAGKNKAELEALIAAEEAKKQPPKETESDGSDLLGAEPSKGADPVPSEDAGEVQTTDGGSAGADSVTDPVPPAADPVPEAEEEKPVPMKAIGRNPVTGQTVHVVE